MTSSGDGVLNRHVDYMRVRGLSPLTIRARVGVVHRLTEYLQGPILYASRDELLAWLNSRVEGLSAGTRRNEISHLKAFYDWCLVDGLLTHSPAERLPTPRAPHYLPRPMSEARFAAALEAADPQMKVILALAGFVGLRACEIARLDWAEVDLGERVLRVARGKGNRARVVRISDPLAEALSVLPWRVGPVIRSPRSGGYCTANAITKRATRFFDELDIPDRLHTLRHRFATAALAGTGDLRAVSEAMGHSSMNTTAIYARSSASAVDAVVRAAGNVAA